MKQQIRTQNYFIGAGNLSTEGVKEDIIRAKAQGYDVLTYTYEPSMGPYVTIELKDYDDKGNELI